MDRTVEIAALLIDVLSAYILAKRVLAHITILLPASSQKSNTRHLRAV